MRNLINIVAAILLSTTLVSCGSNTNANSRDTKVAVNRPVNNVSIHQVVSKVLTDVTGLDNVTMMPTASKALKNMPLDQALLNDGSFSRGNIMTHPSSILSRINIYLDNGDTIGLLLRVDSKSVTVLQATKL